MKFFLLNFLNLMSCMNRIGLMLVNIFFKIFALFFKIRVECSFKYLVKHYTLLKSNSPATVGSALPHSRFQCMLLLVNK